MSVEVHSLRIRICPGFMHFLSDYQKEHSNPGCSASEILPCHKDSSPGFDHCLNVFGMDCCRPFPSQEIFERKPNETVPGLIQEVEVAVGQSGVNQHRS